MDPSKVCNHHLLLPMELEPIPLIIISEEYSHEQNIRTDQEYSARLHSAFYGYLVLTFTWILFLITINSIFQCWRWIIEPLRMTQDTVSLYDWLYRKCEFVDDLVVSLWCIYVAVWWWALLSWIGLKLFRQSKGIQT